MQREREEEIETERESLNFHGNGEREREICGEVSSFDCRGGDRLSDFRFVISGFGEGQNRFLLILTEPGPFKCFNSVHSTDF